MFVIFVLSLIFLFSIFSPFFIAYFLLDSDEKKELKNIFVKKEKG